MGLAGVAGKLKAVFEYKSVRNRSRSLVSGGTRRLDHTGRSELGSSLRTGSRRSYYSLYFTSKLGRLCSFMSGPGVAFPANPRQLTVGFQLN